jgi:xyloglucan fucosyltransferase
MMAVLSGRLLMLENDASFAAQVSMQWDSDWKTYSHLYDNQSRCTTDYNRFSVAAGDWCKQQDEGAGTAAAAKILQYSTNDYELPMLQVNPGYELFLQQLVPSGSMFHAIAQHAFQPTAAVLEALQPYQDLAGNCLLGLQVRSLKPMQGSMGSYVQLEQYVHVARSIAQQQLGSVFVAADTNLFGDLARMLPERQVWWSNLTQATIESVTTAGGNPGSDVSAMVDLLLLSRCKHIAVTAGSSFGQVAAAWGDVKPVIVTRGPHEQPFYAPWFWASVTSEPCMWKVSHLFDTGIKDDMRQLFVAKHPLSLYHQQCH